MLLTYEAVAFDPERHREAPGTREEASQQLVSPLTAETGEAVRIISVSVVCDRSAGLTRGGEARGTARRCNAPARGGRRWAPEGGRWGRTAVQLWRRQERHMMRTINSRDDYQINRTKSSRRRQMTGGRTEPSTHEETGTLSFLDVQ